MFTDNGDAVKSAAMAHLKATLPLIAAAMETMEPEKLMLIARHLEQGARFGVRTLAPEPGKPPVTELLLWPAEAGELTLASLDLPAATPGHVH